MDEDAYARLTAYFEHFKALLDKDTQSAKEEVMTDLENRIAELFDQGIGGASYRVVNLDLVTRVVEQLGMPDGSKEPETFTSDKASEEREEARTSDNPQNGVCAGLAAFLNVDLTVVRIVTLLTLLLYGTGFLVYLVLWIVVPVAKTPADKCMMRGFEPTAENMARFSGQRRNGYGK